MHGFVVSSLVGLFGSIQIGSSSQHTCIEINTSFFAEHNY